MTKNTERTRGRESVVRVAAIGSFSRGRVAVPLMFLIGLLLQAGCAMTGSTLNSGVGDLTIFRPPYYAGSPDLPAMERIVHLPISYQRGAEQPAIFEPDLEGSISTLLAEMNGYLDALRGGAAIDLVMPPGAVPPDVRFGCDARASFECDIDAERYASQGTPGMLLAVGRPSDPWVDAISDRLSTDELDHTLLITLEIGEYWARQKDWRGGKEIRLGTGYTQKVPWLTSLDQPVQVLQLTGALIDRNGRALRIGAEGLLAKRTNIAMSAFGFQSQITQADVNTLAALRRPDLAGAPLVWEVALSNLVRQLTGEGVMR